MKGIILNLKSIKQLYELGPNAITVDEIKQFTMFEGKTVKVKKGEFFQIIEILYDLNQKGFLNKIDNSQLFYINLSNTVAEFDLVTIFKRTEKNLILNIEVKACKDESKYEEIVANLNVQLNNRVDEHLPQMFIDDDYLAVGYINCEFFSAVLKEKNNEKKNLNKDETNMIINDCSSNSQSLSMIQISENLSNIQNVYQKLKSDTFKMYSANRDHLNTIKKAIAENKKVIMCLARPGYGKTVLALTLFFHNDNTKMLIMNEKFYHTFAMSEFYYDNKAYYGSNTFISNINSNTIAIIDEAQRLDRETLEKIIRKAKTTILFGDTGQAFMPTDEFISDEDCENFIKDIVHEDYQVIRLKKSIRYSEEVNIALKYIYDNKIQKKDLKKINNFSLKLYNTQEGFFRDYNNLRDSKKMYKMYTSIDYDKKIKIYLDNNTYIYLSVPRECWNYSISENGPYFGNTLHAISFDVENVFLYLDNLIYSNYREMPIPNNIDERDDVAMKKYINELDILLTRAKKSLHIYVDDLKSYLWFNRKITDINSASNVLNNLS